MGDQSAIEWTDATWNPIRGCSRVSEGCRNCYAERVAGRFSFEGQAYERVASMGKDGGRWNGRVELVESMLDLPLRWKRPRRIFVNSMSDLFHERLTDEQVFRVVDVMIRARIKNGHTFQALTKRPERMLDFARKGYIGPAGLDGVHLGVSVEDQATADERIPLLLQTPAAVRWVSYEPALGPVDFTSIQTANGGLLHALGGTIVFGPIDGSSGPSLDWLVIGGESGPNARPFDLAWARSAIAQCKAAGVPAFFKQAGSAPYDTDQHWITRGGVLIPVLGGWTIHERLKDRKGGDLSELPAEFHIREMPR